MDMYGGAALVLGVVLGSGLTFVLSRSRLAGSSPMLDELRDLSAAQEALRRELQQAREATLLRVGDATSGLRAQLGQAQQQLSEVQSLERGRGTLLAQQAASLRRLEALLGDAASRGAAGEHMLEQALAQLPPDLLVLDAPFGSRVVEYALRLPGGRLLPIDSKWPAAALVERLSALDDETERRRLKDQVRTELRARVRELARYLDGERTVSLAILAVPDAVFVAAPEARAEGWRDGVLIAPYSQTLALALTVYRLAARFEPMLEDERLGERLQRLNAALQRLDDELEGRLARALVQADNARQALRRELAEARAMGEALQGDGAAASA